MLLGQRSGFPLASEHLWNVWPPRCSSHVGSSTCHPFVSDEGRAVCGGVRKEKKAEAEVIKTGEGKKEVRDLKSD